ncbi:MAG TPA: YbhB/YbcL family Raf kinase inhibitor-like protein, partial [Candidatus Babeliales bacterium]|nr:YbhB/YbcL family Raf kinase inhibitor-like protein [Candidatus Babeliales bacterium]
MRYITRKSCYISILLLIGVVLPLDAIRRRRYSSQKEVVSELKLMSSAFSHNGAIPRLYACDGEDMSPPLRWDGVPKGTKSFAIICNDPDSRGGLWVHWLVF